MKMLLSFISVSLFLFSCHKNKNTPVTCDSYSIGMTVGCNITLVATSTSTGQTIKNYKSVIQLDGCNGVGVYDHIHNYYYLYGIVNTNQPILYRVNTTTGIGDTLASGPVLDIIASISNMVCNSMTGKIYFLRQGSYTNALIIYEITPNAVGFSSRLVGNISNWGSYVSSPVVDESTGYIYFLASNALGQGNEYSLIKVNIASGSASFVENTGFSPISGLMYNNNDSMIYGVKSNMPYPDVLSTSLISIDPATGVINTIVDSLNGYLFSSTFDYCNNLYVYGNEGLDPATGKLVKTFSSSAFWENAGIY